jgi:phosphatidate cytidylyltransferase
MAQRIFYGILAILVVLTIVTVDVGVARALSDPAQLGGSTELDRMLAGVLGGVADTGVGRLLSRGSVIPLVFVGVLLAAALEMNRMFAGRSIRPQLPLAIIVITLLFISPWLSAAEWLGRDPAQVEGLQWQVVWLVVGLVGSAILLVMRRETAGMIRDIGATWFMMIYLGLLPSFAIQLRCDRDTPGVDGAWLLLIVLLVTKFSDIGGYLTGSLIGRHKLMPSISPGKTIEGTVGGTLASMGLAMAIAYAGNGGARYGPERSALPALFNEIGLAFGREMGPGTMSPMLRAAVFGLVVAVVAQFGDLFESALKRDAGVKDSGQVIPRFGGILDLIDSPALTLPVAWLLLTAVWALA